MSDQNNSSQEKTEQPTQRKLDKAKDEGKSVTSKEMYVFSSVVMMLALFYFVAMNHQQIVASWKNIFFSLDSVKYGISPLAALKDAIQKILIFILIIGVPGLIITIFTQLFVGGITFSFKAIAWKNSKFNPIEWLKRTFSMKGLVELAKSILKVILLFGIGFYFLYNASSKLVQLSTETFEHAVATSASFFPLLILILIIALLIIGILDWSWQRYSFLKSLRMNRQDLKDESKETEGSPEVKAKIRRLQHETVRKAVKQAESLENVSEASAIIVNPTHFAVALKYDVGSIGAPKVLAMGRGKIAEKII
ncbi:MAG: flagellar biosynthesis protein FlhB, partial [Gammaproteobacteria bacterium]|nr:flagellar biosynthesis protein FlhB [Gammaproteobacteria bacterium]